MSPDRFPGGPVEAVSGAGPVAGPLPYAEIHDPQSLNKFAYTLNNPLRYNDPDGHIALVFPIAIGVAAIVAYLATDAYVKSPAGRQMTADVARGMEAAGSTAAEFARDVGEGMVEAMKGTSVHGFAGVDTGLDRRMLSYMSGETPAGRVYSPHYENDTGPERNIPGSVIDHVVDTYHGVDAGDGKTVTYDPVNDVTVVTGKDGIVSARRGEPRKEQMKRLEKEREEAADEKPQ